MKFHSDQVSRRLGQLGAGAWSLGKFLWSCSLRASGRAIRFAWPYVRAWSKACKRAAEPWVRAAFKGRWHPSWKWGFAGVFYDGAFWCAVFAMLFVMHTAGQLPDMAAMDDYPGTRAVKVLANDGSTIARFGDVHGKPVTPESIPDPLRRAVVAMEDHRFYDHWGIDLLGIARAFWANAHSGRIVQGGSTITQQLAKNVFLSHDRTLRRKIREGLLAVRLEAAYSKEEILALYLNHVFFGARAYGVDAASRRYFGKPHTGLDLMESALLAGLLRAPSEFNPVHDRDMAFRRARTVLSRMQSLGLAGPDEVRQALERDVAFARAKFGDFGRSYFVDWALRTVPRSNRFEGTDIVIKTTLDPAMQAVAEAAVERSLAEHGHAANVGQAALVAMTRDGAVRAMVGGRSYRDSKFNRAVQARRQPGSLFKLVVYLAAFESGATPDTVMVDAPVSVGGWAPKNFKNRYVGAVPLRQAFARSLNSVAVRLGARMGFDRVAEMAQRLGLPYRFPAPPAITLGTLETTLQSMVAAFATIANDGGAVEPRLIEEVRDFDGELLFRRHAAAGRVLDRATVGKIMDVMRASVTAGTGRAADLAGRFVAGKTGTSQDHRDAWFVGFTPELVTGVWMGNDYGASMDDVTGGRLPARLWARFMTDVLERRSVASLPLAYADAKNAEHLNADYLASEYLAFDPSRVMQTDQWRSRRVGGVSKIKWNSAPMDDGKDLRDDSRRVSQTKSSTERAPSVQIVDTHDRAYGQDQAVKRKLTNVEIRRARQNTGFDRGR